MLFFKPDWKLMLALYGILKPFIDKLLLWGVPKAKIKLYENLAKYIQPAIDSLLKLKGKIKASPNALDNACFKQGVEAVRTVANWMIQQCDELEKDL